MSANAMRVFGQRIGRATAFAVLAFTTAASAGPGMELASGAFSDGGAIPRVYTCQGDDVSPPLSWRGVPPQAKSLALVVEDPDAPDPAAPRTTWIHWVLYDIPPTASALPKAVSAAALPKGTRQGRNDWKRTGYGGPCPPIGRHRYFFRLYALDVVLPPLRPPTRASLDQAMAGHIVDEAVYYGTYEKTR
jgi:Raf kinase inhibitor-like YbhB/YbcL family protein